MRDVQARNSGELVRATTRSYNVNHGTTAKYRDEGQILFMARVSRSWRAGSVSDSSERSRQQHQFGPRYSSPFFLIGLLAFLLVGLGLFACSVLFVWRATPRAALSCAIFPLLVGFILHQAGYFWFAHFYCGLRTLRGVPQHLSGRDQESTRLAITVDDLVLLEGRIGFPRHGAAVLGI